MKKLSVLFVCTGNRARSQMAEGILRRLADDRFEVFSAGTEPKGLAPATVTVMREVGIDVASHRSKSIQEFLGKNQVPFVILGCAVRNSRASRVRPEPKWSGKPNDAGVSRPHARSCHSRVTDGVFIFKPLSVRSRRVPRVLENRGFPPKTEG